MLENEEVTLIVYTYGRYLNTNRTISISIHMLLLSWVVNHPFSFNLLSWAKACL